MVKKRSSQKDPLSNMFERWRPTAGETAKLKAVENNQEKFVKLLGEIDRKYKVRSLKTLGVDKHLINLNASSSAFTDQANYSFMQKSQFGIVNQLAESKQLAVECLIPFKFQGLDVFKSMTGPEKKKVDRGMIGAMRSGVNEYTVMNPGETSGKTRKHIDGQMHITFRAIIPTTGKWCLIHPAGRLLIRGYSRVVGHGNMTTSYDAKVWVDYSQILLVGGKVIELSGDHVHYDGTRSEDRTRYFNEDRNLPQRYIFFNTTHTNSNLILILRIDVDTAANEDGLAMGVINQFGFIANTTDEYDTFVIKAS